MHTNKNIHFGTRSWSFRGEKNKKLWSCIVNYPKFWTMLRYKRSKLFIDVNKGTKLKAKNDETFLLPLSSNVGGREEDISTAR